MHMYVRKVFQQIMCPEFSPLRSILYKECNTLYFFMWTEANGILCISKLKSSQMYVTLNVT
jgi:hypothetical protein